MKPQIEDKLDNQIKFAKPEDITQIVSFAYNTYKEVGLNVQEPDFAKITKRITDAVVEGVVLVERNEVNPRHIDGVIALEYSTSWWSNEPILSQLFFYVKPDIKNRISVFNKLLDAASEYGIMNSIPIGQTIVGKDFQRKTKILERKGYTPLGVCLIKEL